MEGSIRSRLQAIRDHLPAEVTLTAVSKFHPVEELRQAYEAGQRVFGESRVQELLTKIPLMPEDVRWHFIGHLQSNKVRPLIGRVTMIESVDSAKLMELIDSESQRAGVTTDVLLQIHVAQEETKFGFTPAEALELMTDGIRGRLSHIRVRGVMGMATNTEDVERWRRDFRAIRDTFNSIAALPDSGDEFSIVSMGMSHDYHEAIACGSTMVRIGTDIFGPRNY